MYTVFLIAFEPILQASSQLILAAIKLLVIESKMHQIIKNYK